MLVSPAGWGRRYKGYERNALCVLVFLAEKNPRNPWFIFLPRDSSALAFQVRADQTFKTTFGGDIRRHRGRELQSIGSGVSILPCYRGQHIVVSVIWI